MRTVSVLLALSLLSGCGGKVVDDGRGSTDGLQGIAGEDEDETTGDAGVTKGSPADAAPESDPGFVDAAPAPPVDVGTAPSPVVDCSEGPVTGSPPITGQQPICSATEPVDMAWAQAMLSCYVDRCIVESGKGTGWCGEIGLTFDGNGLTSNYVELGNSGGCVKYQGYYRSWPCVAGQTIKVSRACTN